MADPTYQSVSLGQFSDRLLHVAAQVTSGLNFQSALKKVAFFLAAKTKENFDRTESPDGLKWKPLKRLRTHGRNKSLATQQPLRDLGILMGSVTADASKQGAIRDITKASLVFGSNIDYGIHHQYGAPRANIPQRQWLGITDKMAETAADIVAYDVAKQVAWQLAGAS
jgi:phage gpG-like protein